MDATQNSIPVNAVRRIVRNFQRGRLDFDDLADELMFVPKVQSQPQLSETPMITDARSLIAAAESFRHQLPSSVPPAEMVVLLFLGLRYHGAPSASWRTAIQDYLDSLPSAERAVALDALYSRTLFGLDDEYIRRVLPLTAGVCSANAVDGMRHQLGVSAVRSGDVATAINHVRESTEGLALGDMLLQETVPCSREWLAVLDELFTYPGNASEVAVFAAADAAGADRLDLAKEILERRGPSIGTASNSEASTLALIHHFTEDNSAAREFAHAARRNDLTASGRLAEPASSWVLACYESNPDARLALLQASSYWLLRLGALKARIELDIATCLLAGDAPRIAALFIGRARRNMSARSADYSRGDQVRYRRIELLLNRFAVTEAEVVEAESMLADRRLTPISDGDLRPFSNFDDVWHFRPERRYDESLIQLRS